jgi:hypothetical protein
MKVGCLLSLSHHTAPHRISFLIRRSLSLPKQPFSHHITPSKPNPNHAKSTTHFFHPLARTPLSHAALTTPSHARSHNTITRSSHNTITRSSHNTITRTLSQHHHTQLSQHHHTQLSQHHHTQFSHVPFISLCHHATHPRHGSRPIEAPHRARASRPHCHERQAQRRTPVPRDPQELHHWGMCAARVSHMRLCVCVCVGGGHSLALRWRDDAPHMGAASDCGVS